MSNSIFRVKTTNENLTAHMRHLAGGEGNDGFEYDLLVQGADRIEELQKQVDAVRKVPRFNFEKAKGKEEYRVVQDEHGEFVFCDDLRAAIGTDHD